MNEAEIRATALRQAIHLGIRDPEEQADYVADYVRGFREGFGESAQRERERCKSILCCAEAVGREDLARVLACTTDLPAGQAVNLLREAPLANTTENAFAAGCVDFLQHLQASRRGKK
jgi:hypothetical protein